MDPHLPLAACLQFGTEKKPHATFLKALVKNVCAFCAGTAHRAAQENTEEPNSGGQNLATPAPEGLGDPWHRLQYRPLATHYVSGPSRAVTGYL